MIIRGFSGNILTGQGLVWHTDKGKVRNIDREVNKLNGFYRIGNFIISNDNKSVLRIFPNTIHEVLFNSIEKRFILSVDGVTMKYRCIDDLINDIKNKFKHN